jgi:hypothetical protein
MRRFNYDFSVSISVDGAIRDQRTIWAHQQDDPYPGGHRYEVVLQGGSTLDHLRGLPLDVTTRLPSDEAHTFLQRIYLTFDSPEEGIPWEFVLNTVDTVRTKDGAVLISGECSPFLRSNAKRIDV